MIATIATTLAADPVANWPTAFVYSVGIVAGAFVAWVLFR